MVTVSGGNIIYGSEYVFHAGTALFPAMSDLSSTQFVVAYADKASGDSGTANVYQNLG